MSYVKRIQQKKFPWGGIALAAAFPAGGSISLSGSIRTGGRLTREEELADVHAQMLLEGTERFSKKDLQVALDSIGASLSFAAGKDRLLFYGRARTPHLEKLLELIVEVLAHPSFPENELQILKKREEAGLSMQSQDTRTQAAIALERMLYPKDHPNYPQATKEAQAELKKITSKSLKAYHARLLNRDSLILSIAGDAPAAKVFQLAQKHFSSLPAQKIAVPKVPAAPLAKPGRQAVRIPQKASIDYMAGAPARITGDHKDYPALLLALQILGNRGGFTGRLMRIVREQEGLTYGAYSYPVGFSHATDGYYLAWATFAPQMFSTGRAAMLRELRRIAAEGVSEEEVKGHRELYEARSRVQLASSGSLAKAAHDTIADNHPLSYLDEFPRRVLKLSAKEVNRALKKYLLPDQVSESAAGPVEKNAFQS